MSSRWNLLWAIPWMILTFCIVQAFVWVPIFITGLVVVPLAAKYAKRSTEFSTMPGKGMVPCWANPVLNELYGNHEDGIYAQGFSIYGWFLRNSGANMRYWPVMSQCANKDTHYFGSDGIFYGTRFVAWSKGFVGLRYEGARYGIWIGFAVNPRDKWVVLDTDWRKYGYSTVAQIFKTDTNG